MAEAETEHRPAEGAAPNEAEHHTSDPMEHILDKPLFGIDATSGDLTWIKRDEEGHVIGYSPKEIGPVKLQFTKHMAGLTIVAVIFFVLTMTVAKRILAGLKEDKAPKGPLVNAFEAVVLYIRDEIVIPVGGHHLGHYTPLFLTYFMFILICNLMGMIPEFGGVTGNASVTLAMGGSIYALVWLLGMYNQGPLHYIIHLVPPGTPFWMWPLMFVLELMGPLIKCFVLCVRLFANMIAGHLIVGSVLSLGVIGPGAALPAALAVAMIFIGVPLALGISILEILVCFLQAYVFTLLAVVFIGAAVHPEH